MRFLCVLCGILSIPALSHAGNCFSFLSNIDCGEGYATYSDTKVGSRAGSVACDCSATCFSGSQNQHDVEASAALTWANCSVPITVNLRGGTQASGGGGYLSQVFVQVLVTNSPLGLYPNPLTNVDDCFTGPFVWPPWASAC